MTRLLSYVIVVLIVGIVACSDLPNGISTQSLEHKPDPLSEPKAASETRSEFLSPSVGYKKEKQFRAAPDRDIFRLAKELKPGHEGIRQAPAEQLVEYPVGHRETFWLIDLSNNKTYQSDFTLNLVTPHAYWYVENSLDLEIAGLRRSAQQFEKNIYPTITRIFGNEWTSNVDNYDRLNILNAKLTDVAGYYSSTDEYPKSIKPRSNQRKIIYLNAHEISPGSITYDQVMAHELQHAIHWNSDATEDTWINEGLSELAASIALGSIFSIREFQIGAPTSLIHWPASSAINIANYGSASLFIHFLTEHYVGRDNLKGLLTQQEDGISGINQYLKHQGYEEDFEDVFKKWAVANILDEHLQANSEILGYDELEIQMATPRNIKVLEYTRSEIPQFAVEYTELGPVSEPVQLSFQGDRTIPLLPIDVGSGCWWSNSGDSIDSTLSRRVKMSMGSTTLLEYEVWFEIEEDWDYIYVEVSTDGGEHWQIVETSKTSRNNPFDNAFGPGYTGKSDGWLADSLDLTSFAVDDLLVRFQYVTDDAINAIGACFRDLSVSASGILDSDYEWEAQGFTFTDNVVSQEFQVQLITIGQEPNVRQLALDSNNSGNWALQPTENGERLILSVGSLAERTRESANYTISLAPKN